MLSRKDQSGIVDAYDTILKECAICKENAMTNPPKLLQIKGRNSGGYNVYFEYVSKRFVVVVDGMNNVKEIRELLDNGATVPVRPEDPVYKVLLHRGEREAKSHWLNRMGQ